MEMDSQLVERVRDASRKLVRELGFMEDTLAGTSLSASAVHAIIEVGSERCASARDLAVALRLEKSTVSRLLKNLINGGLIIERRDEGDGRQKLLALTDRGETCFAKISDRASRRVAKALSVLDARGVEHVVNGLEGYSEALGKTTEEPIDQDGSDGVEIRKGYVPGVVGRTVDMHAAYYSRMAGFGLAFEAKVGAELSEFVTRLNNDCNAIWTAIRAGRIVGSVSIDGEDLGAGKAHLRWFIVADGQRGAGIGKALIEAAMAFVDETGFAETHLWTFSGLDAACRLYERAGFELVEEKPGAQWGEEVQEQRFLRRR